MADAHGGRRCAGWRDDPALAHRLGEARPAPAAASSSAGPAIVQRWLDLYTGLVTRPR